MGDLERKVMDVLWARADERLTVRQVAKEFPDHAYTTVMTVLAHLYRKDMVRRTQEKRAYCYQAAASRETYTAELMHDALGEAPDREAVLVRFVQSVSGTEAEVLRQALADAGRRSSGRGPGKKGDS